MVVSPAHTTLIFARRRVEYHMSGIGSRQWKARKTVPSPPHWDRIDQVVTYKLQINGKPQPNLQCALPPTPFTDSDLSTLLPFKELKITLMISFKYESGKKKEMAERSYISRILLSPAQGRILSLLWIPDVSAQSNWGILKGKDFQLSSAFTGIWAPLKMSQVWHSKSHPRFHRAFQNSASIFSSLCLKESGHLTQKELKM